MSEGTSSLIRKKSLVLKILRPSGVREEPWHNTTKSNSYLTSVSHCRISSADAPRDCQFLPLWANLRLEEMELKSAPRGKKPLSCQLKSKSEPKKKDFTLKTKKNQARGREIRQHCWAVLPEADRCLNADVN